MSVRDYKLYCKIQVNSLTLDAYSALKLTTLTTIIIMALRRAAKISAAAADNFGWLGGAPSVLQRRRRRMLPAGCGGAIRRLRGLRDSDDAEC